MYRRCIFCSYDLGRNEVLEDFSVGRTVAFDPHHGRLWAICSRCGRWNLAPLEERWEAVEGAEQLFRRARQRAHRENIGLARLEDGTRFTRIGAALPGEFAAWRYGRKLRRRLRHSMVMAAGAAVVGLGVFIGSAGLPLGHGWIVADGWLHRRRAHDVDRGPLLLAEHEEPSTGQQRASHLLPIRGGTWDVQRLSSSRRGFRYDGPVKRKGSYRRRRLRRSACGRGIYGGRHGIAGPCGASDNRNRRPGTGHSAGRGVSASRESPQRRLRRPTRGKRLAVCSATAVTFGQPRRRAAHTVRAGPQPP
jgi:hypothetical protein